jgi:hypothetical protein
VVFVSQALGWWSTSGRTSVDLEQLNPADIKGWMTLQQVADGLQRSLETVYHIGGIPVDIPSETALKDLEAIIEVSTLRDILAEYLAGENSTPTEVAPPVLATPTTKPAAMPEGSSNTLHTGDSTGPTPLPPGQILSAEQIKGRMTLREVSEQCAVDLDELLAALAMPLDTDPDIQLKTFIQEGVLTEVTQVQEAVTVLQRQ